MGSYQEAYQSTATKSELLDKSLLILEQKQIRFEETKKDLTLEKTQINQSISDLRVSLSNPQQVSWFDKNSQTVITSTSSSARRALQAELKTTIADRDKINLKLEAALDSIGKTDIALLEKEISNEDERELGPLKYLASTTGWSMDKVVNYFLLLIVFVFDPLAIALVVAANMAFAQIRKPDVDFDLDNPTPPNDKLKNAAEKYKEEQKEDNTTEPSESLKHRVKENQIKLKEIDEDYFSELEGYINYLKEEGIDNLTTPQFREKHYPEVDEEGVTNKRMDIIGQNGNDGLHYDNDLTDSINDDNKTDKKENLTPINPTQKDLENLANALNINYEDESPSIDRLTDTTQTLIVKTNKEKEFEKESVKKKLKYKGR